MSSKDSVQELNSDSPITSMKIKVPSQKQLQWLYLLKDSGEGTDLEKLLLLPIYNCPARSNWFCIPLCFLRFRSTYPTCENNITKATSLEHSLDTGLACISVCSCGTRLCPSTQNIFLDVLSHKGTRGICFSACNLLGCSPEEVKTVGS